MAVLLMPAHTSAVGTAGSVLLTIRLNVPVTASSAIPVQVSVPSVIGHSTSPGRGIGDVRLHSPPVAGRSSLNATSDAAPGPVLVTVMVKPISPPAVMSSATAVLLIVTSGRQTTVYDPASVTRAALSASAVAVVLRSRSQLVTSSGSVPLTVTVRLPPTGNRSSVQVSSTPLIKQSSKSLLFAAHSIPLGSVSVNATSVALVEPALRTVVSNASDSPGAISVPSGVMVTARMVESPVGVSSQASPSPSLSASSCFVIGNLGAIVAVVGNEILVDVGVVGRVTGVTESVAIAVELVGVSYVRAIVAVVGNGILVEIGVVGHITGVAEPVSIAVKLTGIDHVGAVVAVVGNVVLIAVGVVGRITGVTEAVAIHIELSPVWSVGAVVPIIRDVITITITIYEPQWWSISVLGNEGGGAERDQQGRKQHEQTEATGKRRGTNHGNPVPGFLHHTSSLGVQSVQLDISSQYFDCDDMSP